MWARADDSFKLEFVIQEIVHKMQTVGCLIILLNKSIEGPKTEQTSRPSYPFVSNSILLSVTVSRHDTINRFFSEINIL